MILVGVGIGGFGCGVGESVVELSGGICFINDVFFILRFLYVFVVIVIFFRGIFLCVYVVKKDENFNIVRLVMEFFL